MIISASRRTDIPAFYSEWFMNRIEAGYCTVPNPFNRSQVSRVSLEPAEIDVISFWTRQPRPQFSHLERLTARGYHYYFQFTVLNYPRFLERNTPSLKQSLYNFQQLAELIGADRVIWRYDPIIFTPATGASFHQENYHQIAEALKGYTHRSVISFVDIYRKNETRLKKLRAEGQSVVNYNGAPSQRFDQLAQSMVKAASANGMTIQSCAEKIGLSAYGIYPGQCIDSQYIAEQFGVRVSREKDRGQRKLCRCVVSRDIGMYDCCLFGCQYCYATGNSLVAQRNFKKHEPTSPSLLGRYE